MEKSKAAAAVNRKKVMGQLRFALREQLRVFDLHGLGVFFTEVEEDLMALMAQAHFKLLGFDVPYDADDKRFLEELVR
ncbi:MAG: hypothetical protein ACRKGH_02000 [Dehalogenimonas sp.]